MTEPFIATNQFWIPQTGDSETTILNGQSLGLKDIGQAHQGRVDHITVHVEGRAGDDGKQHLAATVGFTVAGYHG